MDLQMPVKDGYQTTLYIRNEMNLTIPIIAMTAHSLVGEQEHCFAVGMDAYVPKPFKQATLLDAIKTVIIKDSILTQKKKINLSYLDEMSCGDENFRKEMINLFIEKIPNEEAQMEEAFNNNDYQTVQKMAHKMKSSLDMFMQEELANYLPIIENEAKLGQFSIETADKISILHFGIIELVKNLKELL
jgi:DNA-binding NarL/FixJ family response regulator